MEIQPEPRNHNHIIYNDVRVPLDHLLGPEDGAKVLAQRRLGGGRIHHAMRTIAQCKLAFDMMCERALSRESHGKIIGEHQMVQEKIADSYAQIRMLRLFVLETAWKIDNTSTQECRTDIAAVKYTMAKVLRDVSFNALHILGSLGTTDLTPIQAMYAAAPTMGIADGVDEVHKATVARNVLKGYRPHEGYWPTEYIPAKRAAAWEKMQPKLDADPALARRRSSTRSTSRAAADQALVMSEFDAAAQRVRDGADATAEARAIVATLDDDEVIDLLDGDVPFWPGLTDMTSGGYYRHAWPAARNDRVGIPGFAFTDGPRGVVIGNATCFPVAMARAATFDRALEEEIGRVIGLEARAAGATYFGGVCVNLLRHPAWGRAQETYGEDPHLLGEMGAALTRGVQEHVLACVKHFACNSMENARFTVDVTADERALHEVYLPHFRAGRARGRGQRHELLQLAERRVGGPVPRAAHRGAARRVGLRRVRDHRLHLRSARPGAVGARRARHRDAVRPAARRAPCATALGVRRASREPSWSRRRPVWSRRCCASPIWSRARRRRSR